MDNERDDSAVTGPRIENLRCNIVLVGITGSGKSTVGRHLAVLLGMGFLDLDHLIEKIAGRKITDIFAQDGENAFRALELRALEMIQNIRSHVVALGGGTLQDEHCLSLTQKIGPIVWLKPSADEVARRLYMRVQELEKRPLFKDLVGIEDRELRRKAIFDRVTEMNSVRSSMYRAADVVLDGGYVTPETSACQLKEILLSMNLMDGSRMRESALRLVL